MIVLIQQHNSFQIGKHEPTAPPELILAVAPKNGSHNSWATDKHPTVSTALGLARGRHKQGACVTAKFTQPHAANSKSKLLQITHYSHV